MFPYKSPQLGPYEFQTRPQSGPDNFTYSYKLPIAATRQKFLNRKRIAIKKKKKGGGGSHTEN